MDTSTIRVLTFVLTLALALPASLLVHEKLAEAGPFDAVRRAPVSKRSGVRKSKKTRRSSDSKNKKKRSRDDDSKSPRRTPTRVTSPRRNTPTRVKTPRRNTPTPRVKTPRRNTPTPQVKKPTRVQTPQRRNTNTRRPVHTEIDRNDRFDLNRSSRNERRTTQPNRRVVPTPVQPVRPVNIPARDTKTPRRVMPTPTRSTPDRSAKTPRRGTSNPTRRPDNPTTKTPRRNDPRLNDDRRKSPNTEIERNDDFDLNRDSRVPRTPVIINPPKGPTVVKPHDPVVIERPEPTKPPVTTPPPETTTPDPKTPRRDPTPEIDHNDPRRPNPTNRRPGHSGNTRHPGRGHDHDTTIINETNVYNDHDDYYRGGDYYEGDTYYGDGYDDGRYRGGDYYGGDTYYGDGYDDRYRGGDYYEGDTYVSSTSTHRRTSYESGGVSTRVEKRNEVSGSAAVADPYITLGLGLAGLSAGELAGETMSGTDFNLGIGVKGSLISGEFGVHYGGYAPESSARDISLYGASIDMRLQPRLGIFEPYALIGAGLHGLSDSAASHASTGASVRLGLGADIRIDDYGISARYLHSIFAFDDPNFINLDGELDATNDQFGVNLLMYF